MTESRLLIDRFPEIAAQYSKNNQIELGKITWGSNRKVIWVCEKGHKWETKVCHRTGAKSGCPYCCGQRVISGETDLATTHPHLVECWSPNNDRKVTEVSRGSVYEALWLCPVGHEYPMAVYNKIKGLSCSYCSGQRLLKGFNDLATTHPHLLHEWADNEIAATDVSAGSRAKIQWKCTRKHTWRAPVYHRTKTYGNTGCPHCALFRTSKVEQQLYARLENKYDIIYPNKYLKIPYLQSNFLICDILIESQGKNFVIEYDGSYWHHDTVEKDSVKTRSLLDNNFWVFRIREQSKDYKLDLLPINHKNLKQIQYQYSSDYGRLDQCVEQIMTWINRK